MPRWTMDGQLHTQRHRYNSAMPGWYIPPSLRLGTLVKSTLNSVVDCCVHSAGFTASPHLGDPAFHGTAPVCQHLTGGEHAPFHALQFFNPLEQTEHLAPATHGILKTHPRSVSVVGDVREMNKWLKSERCNKERVCKRPMLLGCCHQKLQLHGTCRRVQVHGMRTDPVWWNLNMCGLRLWIDAHAIHSLGQNHQKHDIRKPLQWMRHLVERKSSSTK
jgi:hypothetical protein